MIHTRLALRLWALGLLLAPCSLVETRAHHCEFAIFMTPLSLAFQKPSISATAYLAKALCLKDHHPRVLNHRPQPHFIYTVSQKNFLLETFECINYT